MSSAADAAERLTIFGKQQENDKLVDPHHFLLGRERPVQDSKEILGRGSRDAEVLFPKKAQASASTTGTYTVNGCTLNEWTCAQLETLSQAVLRQRSNAIRSAVGEAICPPASSGQPQDLICWILHMQAELAHEDRAPSGRTPDRIAQQEVDRPVGMRRSEEKQVLPFGPRTGHSHEGTRDHYSELLVDSPECADVPPNRGIVSQRSGGEGRRHLSHASSMVSCGVSSVDAKGMGRRAMTCRDNLMEQKRDMEAGSPAGSRAPAPRSPQAALSPSGAAGRARRCGDSVATTLQSSGSPSSDAGSDGYTAGRRHGYPSQVDNRMENIGMSKVSDEEARRGGRKLIEAWGGTRFSAQEEQEGYQSTWKKNPRGLRGPPQLV